MFRISIAEPYSYRVLTLALLLWSTAVPAWGQIQGIVTAATDQQPIAAAQIRIQGATAAALSDSGGFFSLDDERPFPFKLVAGAAGYYNQALLINDSTDLNNLLFELAAIDTTIVADHPFNTAGQCSGCHFSQFSEWRTSSMAGTGLNTWVFDLLNGEGTVGGSGGFVYQRDSVHRDRLPNSSCSACHSPVHWLSDIENAGMGDIHAPNQAMEDGVTCEVCHRAYSLAPDKLNWPGVSPEALTLLRGPQVIQFGLLGDADYSNATIMRPGYNPLLRDTLCASCHQENNDHNGDGDFEDPGSVPHETTYSEYLRYRQAEPEGATQTCVGCHMPATESIGYCSFSNVIRDPGTIRSHELRGTSADYLENALTLSVGVAPGGVADGSLQIMVGLNNHGAGHAVPTGIAIRNIILLVEARDAQGNRLTQLSGDTVDAVGGIGDPAQGFFAGLPGFAFYKDLASGEERRVFYTEADRIAADTRIQAGETYFNTFAFALDQTQKTDDLAVDVRVIYRRAFYDLILAKDWTETGLGAPLPEREAPHFGTLMERDTRSLAWCDLINLDGEAGIALSDLQILAAAWQQAGAHPFDAEARVTVLDLTAMTNCRTPAQATGGSSAP